jgi:MYXO-CTERM domain-containing protein
MAAMRHHAFALAALVGLATPAAAHAFCGFYVSPGDQKLTNDATMVVLMREGMRTVLSMQNNYKGPPTDFAMVVPVPVVLQKENVKTLPRDVFDKVDRMASPRLVEYWEQDPCAAQEGGGMAKRSRSMPTLAPAAKAESASDLGVRVEAEFTVGEYEVVILSARDSGGLDTWLRQNNYKIPEGAEPVLRPYVAQGMKFFVAKVNATKVKFEGQSAILSPLRFHYDSDTFSLPVRLGLLNSNGKQELLVHILARGKRYEVANYPNVTIPTNYDVSDEVKDRFGAFYAALFDRTMEKHPGAIVTEYAWDAQSCDPCPGPTLRPSDMITLGADVLAPTDPPPGLATPPGLAAKVTLGTIENPDKMEGAERRIMSATSRFESCYTTELARSPSPKGRVTISATVGRGRILSISSATTGTIPATLASCVESVVRTIYFPRNDRTGKLVVPIDLTLSPGEAGQQGWWRPPPVNAWGFTLTRLHTRYSKEVLGQDLIFREAPAIVGGREEYRVPEQAHDAKQGGSTNNFQARYVIRHAWKGPVSCNNPRRGVWGGPPSGQGQSAPKAAEKIAYVPRGGVELASMVKQSIPDLGIVGPKADVPTPPPGPGPKGNCGCSTEGSSSPLLPSALAALGALVLHERRRRRRG